MHIVADATIGSAYFAVAFSIHRFATLRGDFPFKGLFVFFAVVFALCGVVHISDILMLWWPVYGAQGVFKVIAAVVSVITAVALWRLVPQALALPSPAKLRQVNNHLHQEVLERRRAEHALLTAKHKAESANRAKSEFLANMSHELRTPLNAIIGFADALGTGTFGPLTDKQSEYTNHIAGSGKHLLAIINDILDISRVDAGKVELHEEEVDVAELMRGCATLLAGNADGRGIAVAVETPAPLPALWGDSLRLRQIVLNLLSNAIKFTAEGGFVRLTATADEHALTVTVADNGIGMAAGDIPRALETFNQIDNTLARRYDGTGLGLPLARALVELHGGTLTIDSTLGRGTTVTLRFPRCRLRPVATAAAEGA